MTDSIRQLIATAFDTRLETITVANGYETNLGANIFEWKTIPLEQVDLPGAVWRDTDDQVEVTVGQDVHTLTVEVDITVSGTTAPATLRKAIADVVKAVKTDVQFGGLVQDTTLAGEDIIADQEEKRIIGARLSFEVVYVTKNLDPYS